ncbi:unnamed protein product, partial [Sphagnum compactum]
MLKQGSGGAYEISGRLTAMVGWASTADFSEQWVWDSSAKEYALNQEVAQKLRSSNPEAYRNMLKRLLEASSRGFWAAPDDVLLNLRQQYEDVEDLIEG